MIGNKLRKLRESSAYTQQQVADSLNIDRSTYSYYESGKTKPDIDMIMRLSKIFNVHYTLLLDNETNENCSDSGSTSCISFKKKTLSNSRVYELTKKEQQMIINFRMLSTEMQDKFSEQILTALNSDETSS